MFTTDELKELSFDQKIEVMKFKAKFHSKKAKATAEMKRIPKNGFNKFHNYAYAQESDVKDHVREILRENDLSISETLSKRTETLVKTKQGEATKTDVSIDFTITDCETGYSETYRLDGVSIDNGDKGIFKAYTATIKYFLMNEFLIPTGDEVDAESPQLAPHTQQQNHQPQQNQRPQQQNQRPAKQNQATNTTIQTWKQIMNAEDRLADISGKSKFEVRNSLEHHFGKLGKYKELDEDKAIEVLKKVKEWISKYEPPTEQQA